MRWSLSINHLKALLIGASLILGIASLVIAFQVLNPTPPRVVTISTGPVGSAYERFARQYRDILAESGVDLVLLSSGGASENLSRLGNGEADLGFVTMGTPDASQVLDLRSLGAVFFEPLWLFTRDISIFDGSDTNLLDQRISIGPVGSRTNMATRYLFELNGLSARVNSLLELPPDEAAELLSRGKLDVVSLVSNSTSRVLRRLLSMESATLVNFDRADAYAALFPELTKLIVPAGVGDLALDLPPKNTQILAFTAILGVNKGLHPITQGLVLDAVARVHAAPDMFHETSNFPVARSQVIPLSDTARAFYTDGRPLLLRLLPYWLAVLVMQVLVAAIPIIGIVLPLLKLMPAIFNWAMRHQFYKIYVELRGIDRGVATAGASDIQLYGERLDELESQVTTLRVPVSYASTLYALKAHINAVRQKLVAAADRQ